MLLSRRPIIAPAEPVGDPISEHDRCDCDECHNMDDVVPPSHLLFVPRSAPERCDWERLCPATGRGRNSTDITVHWSPGIGGGGTDARLFAAQKAAGDMISRLAPEFSESEKEEYVFALASYLLEYARFVDRNLEDRCSAVLKLRMVSSRGETGTKCPLWHVDNVPVRWIQALVGPGCEFVTNTDGVNWEAWEDSRQLRMSFSSSLEATNRYRVPDANKAGVYKAKQNEVALLRGGRWSKCCRDDTLACLPTVHRSPARIPSHQGRLLFTQDVVLEHDH